MAAVVDLDVARVVREQLLRLRPDLGVLAELLEERERQDTKWGEQNHPDLNPGLAGEVPAAVRLFYGLRPTAFLRDDVEADAESGTSNWLAIALEELGEAIDEAIAGDDTALRTELIQLAAVFIQWVQAIDRRSAGRQHHQPSTTDTTEHGR